MSKQLNFQKQTLKDCVDERTARLAHATFNGNLETIPRAGDDLHPLWHWFAFPPNANTHDLNIDGHPMRPDYVPPKNLSRRMWASGDLIFFKPLKVGEEITKISQITEVSEKASDSGHMVFVKYLHELYGGDGLAIKEQQNIVYLAQPEAFNPPQKKYFEQGRIPLIKLNISNALLFRYSALTFNAHRIHFDLPFTRDVEKYPDLIIHGPLQATFLINAAIKAKGTIPNKFSFRGIHPAFANEPLDLGLKNASHGFELFTSSLGHQCMQASAVWEEKS